MAKALEGLGHLRAALKPDQITVSSVMMTSTVDSLAEFPAILAGLNIKNYVLQGLVDYATGLDAETIEWQRALPAYADRIKAAGADAGVHVSFALPDRMAAEMGHAPPPPEEKPQHRAKQCHLPWLAPVVDKDGRMFPCCFAMSHADGTVGNVKESNALDLWRVRVSRAFAAPSSMAAPRRACARDAPSRRLGRTSLANTRPMCSRLNPNSAM